MKQIKFLKLCARIIEKANFDAEPAGIQGLTVPIKSHPELQGSLVDSL